MHHMDNERGFSLLEMLMALAIMSFASLILFQSVGTMLRLSEKAVAAADRTLEDIASRKSLSYLVDGIVAAWPESEAEIFKGTTDAFSGLTAASPVLLKPKIESFNLYTNKKQSGGVNLIYTSNDQDVILYESPTTNVAFAYMGPDLKWHETWPPDEISKSEFFETDREFLATPPLPISIKISFLKNTQYPETDWVFNVSKHYNLPFRESFTIDREAIRSR